MRYHAAHDKSPSVAVDVKRFAPVARATSTARPDTNEAVADLLRRLAPGKQGIGVLFCTSAHQLQTVAEKLRRCGASANFIAVLTGRAIGPDGMTGCGMSGFYLPARSFRCAKALIKDVASATLPDVGQVVRSLRSELGVKGPLETGGTFCLLFIGAEAHCEERLAATLGLELGRIPLVGGSVGDMLLNPGASAQGVATLVHEGRALRGAAVVVLVATSAPFRTHTHTHHLPGARRAVITRADPERRLVHEINGRPAAAEYATLCGLKSMSGFVAADFAAFPLMVRIGGNYYARGIQRVLRDGKTLEFACSIDDGLVVRIARRGDMIGAFRNLMRELRASIGQPQLIIGFDCAARTALMEQAGFAREIEGLMRENAVTGFATLGEQINTIHTNNSFTCVGIGMPGPATQ
jgi:hypothetical protein